LVTWPSWGTYWSRDPREEHIGHVTLVRNILVTWPSWGTYWSRDPREEHIGHVTLVRNILVTWPSWGAWWFLDPQEEHDVHATLTWPRGTWWAQEHFREIWIYESPVSKWSIPRVTAFLLRICDPVTYHKWKDSWRLGKKWPQGPS
jgi:hypothetical protein